MNPNDNDDSRSVALYWDFENLHAGLLEAKYGEGAYAKQDNRALGVDVQQFARRLPLVSQDRLDGIERLQSRQSNIRLKAG